MANNEIKVPGRTFPPRSENNTYSASDVKYQYTLLNVNPAVYEK